MTLVIGHVPVSSGAGSMGHGELAGISFFEKIFIPSTTRRSYLIEGRKRDEGYQLALF